VSGISTDELIDAIHLARDWYRIPVEELSGVFVTTVPVEEQGSQYLSIEVNPLTKEGTPRLR